MIPYLAVGMILAFFGGICLAEAHFKYIIQKQADRIQKDYEIDSRLSGEETKFIPAMYAYASSRVKELKGMI